MSLYLGKDNANKNILHITKGTSSEATMRSGIQSNTVFHSTLPFISVNLSEMGTLTNKGASYIYDKVMIHAYPEGGYLYMVSIPSELLTYFRGSKSEPFAFLTYNILSYDHVDTNVAFSALPYGVSPGSIKQYVYTNSSGHIVNRSSATHIVLGTTKLIYNLFIIRLATLPSLSGPINISSQVFKIGSYDLRNYRFLGPEDTNNYDPVVNLPGFSRRLVNSNGHVGSGVSIVSSPNHEIHFGGNRIFSSGVSVPERVKQVHPFSAFFPTSTYRAGLGEVVYSAIINSNISIGNIYSIELSHPPFMDYVESGEASTFKAFTGSFKRLLERDFVYIFNLGPGAPPGYVCDFNFYIRESGTSLVMDLHVAGSTDLQAGISLSDSTINGIIYTYSK